MLLHEESSPELRNIREQELAEIWEMYGLFHPETTYRGVP